MTHSRDGSAVCKRRIAAISVANALQEHVESENVDMREIDSGA